MKTTPKHFEIFKKECLRLIDLFELGGWRVYFQHCNMNERYGEMNSDEIGHVATLGLNLEWVDEVRPCNEVELKRLALHETLHLLLAKMSDLGKSRFVDKNTLYSAEEELVHKLEKLL